MEGKDHGAQRVRLSITARRVRIDPHKKRRSYIRRLKWLMVECDRIIADPHARNGWKKIKWKK